MTTRYPRIRRQVPGIGFVQLATGARSKRDYERRVVLFDELVEDSQLGVIRALLAGEITWEELIDAKRRDELRGGAIIGNIALARPLWTAIAETLPKMGRTPATRARYRVSFNALERQRFVAWPRELAALRVRDLRDVEWSTLCDAWVKPAAEGGGGKSAAYWNHVARAVLAFLSKYLKSELHPFRLEVREQLRKLAEEERVPDLTPILFRRILDATPAPVQPMFITLMLTGMRVRSEYLRCREEHKLPGICAVRVPGTKTDKSKSVIAIDAEDWPWIDAAIPAPIGYQQLRRHWQRACVTVGAGRYLETGKTRRIRVKLERGQQYVHRGHGDVRTVMHAVEHRDVPELRYVGLRLHDLRHALGQWSHDAGQPLSRIKEALRHTTLAMTERYARTSATRQVSSAAGRALRETAS